MGLRSGARIPASAICAVNSSTIAFSTAFSGEYPLCQAGSGFAYQHAGMFGVDAGVAESFDDDAAGVQLVIRLDFLRAQLAGDGDVSIKVVGG